MYLYKFILKKIYIWFFKYNGRNVIKYEEVGVAIGLTRTWMMHEDTNITSDIQK